MAPDRAAEVSIAIGMREYMARRYKTDPKFRELSKKRSREYQRRMRKAQGVWESQNG
jgi:hypothetical protein